MRNESKRIQVGPFVARMVHFNEGWRWFAFESGTLPERDDNYGFAANGYADVTAARRAMRAAEKRLAEGR